MKLPVQAPAVVRGSLSWPLHRPDRRGGTSPAIEPAAGGVVDCQEPTPRNCVCDNGVATCCSSMDTRCDFDSTTGACNCFSD
jgi:hypothetical protein